jgi:RNA recognition motif-containing protein
MNIYISNLSSIIRSEELKQLFSTYGAVKSAEIVDDVFTGKSRGFGYVEMEDNAAAQTAIEGLNKTEFHSLTISVKEAELKNVQKGSYKVGNGAVEMYRFRKN